MSFANRYGPWAVVAGASEGTGRCFARQIAAKGINCILIARREEPLAKVAEEIRSKHDVDCIAAAIDLAAPNAFDQIAAAVGEREVGLYIANAGADPNGSHFLDLDIDVWTKHVNRSVLTTMRCCHHFGGLMRERGRGGLMLVGSGACYSGGNFMATYSASKAFELCFAESLWSELRPYGVDVLYLVMTTTDTPALRKLLAEKGLPTPASIADPSEVAEVGLAQLPHGPLYNWGQKEDEVGFATNSAKQRRERILAINEASKRVFGENRP